ncbi:phosphohistidine phosphatase SixA [Thalassotalea loyana]|uniref:Phosphohistidine phosphatase SixA n=1 Tax=Thalassotalea loyana TaxID=280483 RepID=A0ABQ6HIP9_9GAMM|nr:phosphohistidine phosphatase SixA [Thalassotalea loyana]GLX86687.1 phosphohistidine phosphatase SixA [Thalassotalea loyana]
MQILIMRHGHAEPFGQSDAMRELSRQGQIEAEKMAEFLRSQEQIFDVIYQSPYVRAQQTADIVAKTLGQESKLQTLDLITPLGDAKDVHDYIDGILAERALDNILFVCHMPIVSYLVETLTAGVNSPIFQTAAIAQIEYNPSSCSGELIAMNAPLSIS